MEPTTQTNNPKSPADFSIKELVNNGIKLFGYLRRKWKTMLICAIAGALLGLCYAAFRKTIYSAELSFTVEGDDDSSIGISGLAEQFGVDLGDKKSSLFEGDNLVVFFKSRAMVQKALLSEAVFGNRTEVLANRYIEFNNLRSKWSRKPALRNITFKYNEQGLTRLKDSVLGLFYKQIVKDNLSVGKTDKKLSIINLEFKAKDELFAKAFAETITANVVDFYIKTQTSKTQHNVDALQFQTDSVRRVLNSAISGMAESTDAAPNANPLKQVLLVPSQKKEVDVEASKDVLAELIKNLELSKYSLRKETPLIEYIDQPILPLENDRVTTLKGTIIGFVLGIVFGIFMLSAIKILKSIMA